VNVVPLAVGIEVIGKPIVLFNVVEVIINLSVVLELNVNLLVSSSNEDTIDMLF